MSARPAHPAAELSSLQDPRPRSPFSATCPCPVGAPPSPAHLSHSPRTCVSHQQPSLCTADLSLKVTEQLCNIKRMYQNISPGQMVCCSSGFRGGLTVRHRADWGVYPSGKPRAPCLLTSSPCLSAAGTARADFLLVIHTHLEPALALLTIIFSLGPSLMESLSGTLSVLTQKEKGDKRDLELASKASAQGRGVSLPLSFHHLHK